MEAERKLLTEVIVGVQPHHHSHRTHLKCTKPTTFPQPLLPPALIDLGMRVVEEGDGGGLIASRSRPRPRTTTSALGSDEERRAAGALLHDISGIGSEPSTRRMGGSTRLAHHSQGDRRGEEDDVGSDDGAPKMHHASASSSAPRKRGRPRTTSQDSRQHGSMDEEDEDEGRDVGDAGIKRKWQKGSGKKDSAKSAPPVYADTNEAGGLSVSSGGHRESECFVCLSPFSSVGRRGVHRSVDL